MTKNKSSSSKFTDKKRKTFLDKFPNPHAAKVFIEKWKADEDSMLARPGLEESTKANWYERNHMTNLMDLATFKALKKDRSLQMRIRDQNPDDIDWHKEVRTLLETIAAKADTTDHMDIPALKKKLNGKAEHKSLHFTDLNQVLPQFMTWVTWALHQASITGCGTYVWQHKDGRDLMGDAMLNAILPKPLQAHVRKELGKMSEDQIRDMIGLHLAATVPFGHLGDEESESEVKPDSDDELWKIQLPYWAGAWLRLKPVYEK